MEKRLTEGTVWKKLLGFAVPICGANLLQAMYGTVDLMIVGLFSDASSVSAVSTGSMTLQTISGIISGLTMGCTILLGRNIGRKDDQAATRTIASATGLFIMVGILLSVFTVLLSGQVADIMNAPIEALSKTKEYIQICGGGILGIVLFNAVSGMFRGLGDSKTPLVLMAIACVTNIVGDLILVGVFHMAVAGAAIATVFAQGLSVVCACFIIYRKGLGFAIDKKEIRCAKQESLLILKYGFPIALQEALTGCSFMIILAILNKFGLIASAGVGVAEKICALMFIVPGAMMSAISAFSAQNIGAGQDKRAKEAMLWGMVITVVVGIIMFLISYFNGQGLASFFTADKDVQIAAADYLKSYSIDCVIVGINFSMMGYLNGCGRTNFVAAQGILSTFLVRVPVSYFMSKIVGVSLFQIGFATPLATVFAIVITGIYLKRSEIV